MLGLTARWSCAAGPLASTPLASLQAEPKPASPDFGPGVPPPRPHRASVPDAKSEWGGLGSLTLSTPPPFLCYLAQLASSTHTHAFQSSLSLRGRSRYCQPPAVVACDDTVGLCHHLVTQASAPQMHDLPSIQVVAEMPCNGAGRVLGYKTLLVWKLTALSGSVYAL